MPVFRPITRHLDFDHVYHFRSIFDLK